MSIAVPRVYYDLQSELHEITHPFLSQHKLNYFQFGRIHEDGATTALVTNLNFLEERLAKKRGNKSYISSEQIDKQTYFFLWNNGLPEIDTGIAREFDLDNGICLVERYADHYHLIAFAAPTKEKQIVNFYLNNLGLLKNFINEFKDKAAPIIARAEQSRIMPTPELQDENGPVMLWSKKKKVTIEVSGNSISLSPREWLCWQTLAYGPTVKEIAARLGLSPRTVETYYNRLKFKLGVNSRSELISLFHALNF